MSLEGLLQSAQVWRAGEGAAAAAHEPLPTGFPALDAVLPEGWPRGALVEVLARFRGIGALRLLLPALARLTTQGSWVAWVSPPYVPYTPALAAAGVELSRVLLVEAGSGREQLWALEQALRSGRVAAALGWAGRLEPRLLRRLQIAAAAGEALGVLFRPQRHAAEVSPAALRLGLAPAPQGRLAVEVLKRRGGWALPPIEIDPP